MFPEKEKPFETTDEAVRWYRALGQEATLFAESDNLVAGADLILDRNPQGYYGSNKETGEKTDPYILDAACMLLEAARATESKSKGDEYRERARGVLEEIIKDESRSMSTRLDSIMYLSDSRFTELYEDFYMKRTEYREFEQEWRNAHEESLQYFNEAVTYFEDSENYANGKVFEWFWILSSRHIQFEEDNSMGIDRWFIRSAFLREDKAHENRLDDISGNFDVSYDEMINDSWMSTGKIQLSNAHKKLRYRQPVKPLTYIIEISNDDFTETMLKRSKTMLKETRSVSDFRIDLNHIDKQVLGDNRKFIETGYLTQQ